MPSMVPLPLLGRIFRGSPVNVGPRALVRTEGPVVQTDRDLFGIT